MTGLRPFQPKQSAPLTGGARFIRGFTRIGSIAAVLTTLIGVPASFLNAKSEYDYAKATFVNATCIAKLDRAGYRFKFQPYSDSALDYAAAGCREFPFYKTPLYEVTAIANGPAPSIFNHAQSLGIGLIVTGVVAIIFYAVFWAIGWLCAGFTRDA
jgi:hypothetical protein